MNVLHICNAYQTNALYQKLFKCLSGLGVHQEVLAPGTKKGEFVKDDVKVILFKRNKSLFYRLLWPLKISRLVSFAQANFSIDQCQLIHAHTLFSDGAVAYSLKKKYDTEYVVAVRNTDLNDYFPLPFFKQLGHKILLNASSIYLISEANKKQLADILPLRVKDRIWDKVAFLPNGIDDVWLSHIQKGHQISLDNIRLIYAGDICENKNIHNVVEAIQMEGACKVVSYKAIGLKESDCSKYVLSLKEMEKKVEAFHLIKRCGLNDLMDEFKHADIYIQPSFTETFGLSYIEALTQGLPIIYSKGQGVDGIFRDGEVGYAVNPNSPKDIITKITLIKENYSCIEKNIEKINFSFYSWDYISQRYYDSYISIMKRIK